LLRDCEAQLYPNALPIQTGANFLAGFEVRNPLCLDLNINACARIATDTRTASARGKRTKTAQFNTTILGKVICNGIEKYSYNIVDFTQ
jgi:hypothetical protein